MYTVNDLISALENRNQLLVIEIINSDGFDVNQVDDSGRYPPLHHAALANNIEAINALLDKGAEIGGGSRGLGDTPLHEAAYEGCAEAIEALLLRGANIDAIDNGGETPLHYATKNGYSHSIIEKLLELGADLEARNYGGDTPLHLAARKPNTKTLKTLLKLGAKVDGIALDQVDSSVRPLIEMTQAIDKIIAKGTTISSDDLSSLAYFSSHKNIYEVVKQRILNSILSEGVEESSLLKAMKAMLVFYQDSLMGLNIYKTMSENTEVRFVPTAESALGKVVENLNSEVLEELDRQKKEKESIQQLLEDIILDATGVTLVHHNTYVGQTDHLFSMLEISTNALSRSKAKEKAETQEATEVATAPRESAIQAALEAPVDPDMPALEYDPLPTAANQTPQQVASLGEAYPMEDVD